MSGYFGSDCPSQMGNPQAWWKDGKPARVTLGNLPRTWRDDRRDELRLRGYGVLLRIVFPRSPLRIVCFGTCTHTYFDVVRMYGTDKERGRDRRFF